MDFMDVIEKGRHVFHALDGLQPPGYVAKLVSNTWRTRSEFVKIVLPEANNDPLHYENDLKSRITCLDGLHGCHREGASRISRSGWHKQMEWVPSSSEETDFNFLQNLKGKRKKSAASSKNCENNGLQRRMKEGISVIIFIQSQLPATRSAIKYAIHHSPVK